jgi:hypothetical protein
MKRFPPSSRSDSPPRTERKTDGEATPHVAELVCELTSSNAFDGDSTLHREIERLASTPSCEGFAAKWQGSTLMTLLGECHRHDWTKNFGHIARLLNLTKFPEFPYVSDTLIAHLLVSNPEMVDFMIDGFVVKNNEAVELENALSNTNHLRTFHIIDAEESEGDTNIARGIGSHHHLKSWHLQIEEEPNTFVPVLEKTLTTLHSLECLKLDILCAWTADHLASIAQKLKLMPTLQRLELKFWEPQDLSGFLRTLVCPTSPLSSLSLRIEQHPDRMEGMDIDNATTRILLQAIKTMPRLESLCVSAHLLPNGQNVNLIDAVQKNCAFHSIELLDDCGNPVELPPALDYALNVNANRIHLTRPAVQAACRAILHPFNMPADVCHEVSRHLMGAQAAPDLRDEYQELAFLSKRIWEYVKGVRNAAMMDMLKNQHFFPKTAVQLMRRHDMITLAKQCGVIYDTQAWWLTSQLPTFKDLLLPKPKPSDGGH